MHPIQNELNSLRLTLLNTAYAKLGKEWNYDNVISPFTRMYYITKGSATVHHSNQTFLLKPGHMYLIPSYSYSRYSCPDYHEQFYISFLEEIANGLSIYNLKNFRYEIEATEIDQYYFERLLTLNPKRGLTHGDPKVYDNRPTLMGFVKENESLPARKYIETQSILGILLSRFIENGKQHVAPIKKGLANVLSYIGENLHRNLTVKELSVFCHLSTDHFSRIFKETFGVRPNAYLQAKRVERAQLLLLTTNNSLAQIASKTGMSTVSYFSRTFKKVTGKTPGNFRKERLTV
ncbi:helix-turn-helix domain-containing protein [Maribacter sp. 2210JD10-5]|uniref:AraC family transcriptional regulator n=1 Tax=Maribacter sp. 2210JD10-5 TaxID=3386272 RepID=UPI0039BC566A